MRPDVYITAANGDKTKLEQDPTWIENYDQTPRHRLTKKPIPPDPKKPHLVQTTRYLIPNTLQGRCLKAYLVSEERGTSRVGKVIIPTSPDGERLRVREVVPAIDDARHPLSPQMRFAQLGIVGLGRVPNSSRVQVAVQSYKVTRRRGDTAHVYLERYAHFWRLSLDPTVTLNQEPFGNWGEAIAAGLDRWNNKCEEKPCPFHYAVSF